VVLGGSCRRTTACASQQASMTWVVLRQQSKRTFSNPAIVETPAAIEAAYAEAGREWAGHQRADSRSRKFVARRHGRLMALRAKSLESSHNSHIGMAVARLEHMTQVVLDPGCIDGVAV
jgi:hypothetical protein